MTRYILTMLFLILAGALQAQSLVNVKGSGYILTQQREVAFFHSIDVSSKISVYIVPGEFQPITVEADNNLFSYIKTVVRDNVLKIYIPDTVNIIKFNDMNVLISMPSVVMLQARQGSYISASPQAWHVDQIKLQVSSGSRIKLAAHVDKLDIDAKTSSIIELKGSARQFEAGLKTAARLYARDFEIEKADIEMATGARAEIKVNQEIEYDLCGNAKLVIHGEPKVLKAEVNSGGKVVYDK